MASRHPTCLSGDISGRASDRAAGRLMCPKARILVVDDEAPIGDIICTALGKRGYDVIYASDAEAAIDVFHREHIDLFILDVMMPRMDGFAFCEWLRRRSNTPVIMLTAKGSLNDIVRGFDAGADDYITKPFTMKELEVRVQAILRRMAWANEQQVEKVLKIGAISVDMESRLVALNGTPIHVTPIEFELLFYLMSHAGQAISKNVLFRDVWGYDVPEDTNLVEVGIRRLREKIEQDPSTPEYILTVRGIGYKFRDAASAGRTSAGAQTIDEGPSGPRGGS